MAAIRIFNDNNSVYIAGRAYQPGSLQASYTGDNVNVVQLHNSKAVIREVRYSYILDKDGNTWGSTAADTVTALNNYIGATNPDGIIKSTNKITDLTGVTAADFASKPGYTVFVGSSDGSLQTSNAVLLDGNNLRVNGELTSSTNANLKLKPGGTGNVEIGNFEFDADQTGANDGDVLTFDSTSGTIALSTPTGGGGSSPWTTSGSDIYYTTGNVGVGTTTPSEALDVSGIINSSGKIVSGGVLQWSGGTYQISNGTNSVNIGKSTWVGSNGVTIGADGGGDTGAIVIGGQAKAGSYSVAIGQDVGAYSNAGSNSVHVGKSAGNNSTGTGNVSVGHLALYLPTTGTNNVAVGKDAAYGAAGTSTFSNTVAVGYEALKALTTGGSNTALGDRTSRSITSGSGNTSVGILGLSNVTTTSNNTSVGAQALQLTTGSNNTAVGFQSGNSITTGSDNALFGYASGIFNTGSQNVSLGSRAMYGSPGSSTSSNTVAVGYQALTALTTGTGNTAVGYQAGAALTTGNSNTLFGYSAGGVMTTTGGLTAVGFEAGRDTSGGYGNTYYGYRAGDTHTGHNSQTMIGVNARNGATSGDDCLAIGSNSYVYGSNQTAVGPSAQTANGGTAIGSGSRAGSYAVAIGQTAGSYSRLNNYSAHVGARSGNDGQYSVALGYDSLAASSTSGQYNVALGYASGLSITSGSSNILIGYQAGSTLTTESNKLYIENSNSTTPLIYGEFDNDILRVNGSFEVTGGVTADDGGLTAAGDYGKGAEIWYQGASTPTAGSVYYLDSSGNWANTDASAVATAKGMIAVSTGTDSDVDGMLIKGFVYVGTDPGGSVGDVVYLSETANQLTTTAPTTASAVVRVCGYKVGTNIVYFDPSKDWIELS